MKLAISHGVLSATEIAVIAEHYDGLELTHVDDETALSRTVGDLCRSHEAMRAERNRAVTLLNAVLAVVMARRAIYEYLPAEVREVLDKLIPPRNESYEQKWIRLGFRVEWSGTPPRAYEIRRVGCVPSDNDCLARLPTVQDVDAWIAERVKERG